jgi:outer membrane protein assembly factor BamE (lipoprotein component of BamABCDE complex)
VVAAAAVAAAAVLALLPSCGAAHHPVAYSRDGKAVIQDAYDGRLDRNWSCGSLRAAVLRLPSDSGAGQTIPLMIDEAAGRACDEALADVHPGSTMPRVRKLLGTPDRSPRCWLYRWPPQPSSAVDGVRLCFSGDLVSRVQVAVHG